MRFFITGATGFIGTHLCRRLLDDGHEVLGLVRSPDKIAPDLLGRLQVLAGDLSIFDDPGRVQTYFVSSAAATSNVELLYGMAAAMDRRLVILRVPKPLIFGAMLGATALSKVLGFANQLDLKQYQQMTAPEFLCSSERLQAELGWSLTMSLPAMLAEAIAGYRERGLLPG